MKPYNNSNPPKKKSKQKISSPHKLLWNFLKYNISQPLFQKPFRLRRLVIYVTYRCNARCFICQLWKTNSTTALRNEITLAQLDNILSDSLFSRIDHININGGETTLRDDLTDMVDVMIKKLPRLKHISMSSNGLDPDRVVPAVTAISELCKEHDVMYSLSISFHGIETMLEKVYGIKNAFEREKKTFKGIKQLLINNGHSLSLNCVLNNVNISQAEELYDWSKKENLPLGFVLGEVRDRFENQKYESKILLTQENKHFLIRFLKKLEEEKHLYNPISFRYHHLAEMLENNKSRTISCHYSLGTAVLGAYGELYYCPHSKNIGDAKNQSAHEIYFSKKNREYFKHELLRSKCKKCPPYTRNRIELEKDLFKYIFYLLKGKSIVQLLKSKKSASP